MLRAEQLTQYHCKRPHNRYGWSWFTVTAHKMYHTEVCDCNRGTAEQVTDMSKSEQSGDMSDLHSMCRL